MLAEQMLNLVEYLHQSNYVHRDLKPANFVVGKYIFDVSFQFDYSTEIERDFVAFKFYNCEHLYILLILYLRKKIYDSNSLY